jgi:hypothetical protein
VETLVTVHRQIDGSPQKSEFILTGMTVDVAALAFALRPAIRPLWTIKILAKIQRTELDYSGVRNTGVADHSEHPYPCAINPLVCAVISRNFSRLARFKLD